MQFGRNIQKTHVGLLLCPLFVF